MSYGGAEDWGGDKEPAGQSFIQNVNPGFGRGRGRAGRGSNSNSSYQGGRPYPQNGQFGNRGAGRGSRPGPGGESRTSSWGDKRPGSDDNQAPTGDNSDVVMVERRFVGRVIGKQGSKIRELQETTGCEIKIQKDEETDQGTPVYLTGSEEGCAHAKRLILELTTDDGGSFGGGGRSGGSNWQGNDSQGPRRGGGFGGGKPESNYSSGESSDVVMVERQFVGRVIGKQGCKIRELQEQTGCQIKIQKDEETDQGTPVYLTGSADGCAHAKRLIQELTSEDRGDSRSGGGGGGNWQSGNDQGARRGFGGGKPDANNYSGESSDVVMVERQFVGRVIGKQGCKIRELQETTGCQIKIQKDEETDQGTPVYLTGSEEACSHAKRLIIELTSEDRSGGGGGGSNWSGNDNQAPRRDARGGFGGGKPETNYSSGGGGGESSDVVMVERQFVGRVIGRQGCKIRELQETTGCEIQIRKEEETDQGTPVYLTGSEEACSHAKRLIQELTSEDRGSFDSRAGSSNWRGANESSSRGGGFSADTTGDDTTQIMIPVSKIGMVIGKRGAKIREIQETTGCKINLPREEADGLEAPVFLQGTEEARRQATEIIDELVSDNLSIFSGNSNNY